MTRGGNGPPMETIRIGWSSGFDLEMTGGSMSRGQAAGGLGDLGLDVLEGEVDVPGEVELDGDVGRAHARGRGDRPEPSTWTRASSSGSTTSFSMTSGAAPSQTTETEIVGKSTSGNWLMPMRVAATRPKTMVAAISIQARTGFLTQTSVRFMAGLPVAPA